MFGRHMEGRVGSSCNRFLVLPAKAGTHIGPRRDHEAYFFPRTKVFFAGVLVNLTELSFEP